MKNLKLIIGIFVISLFISCSSSGGSDDAPTSIIESNLIGVWHLQSHTLNGNSLSNSHDIYEFQSNHRVKITYPDDGGVSEWGDWTLTNSNLVIHNDDSDPGLEYYHLEIQSLATNTLKWKTNISGEGVLIENYSK